MKLGRDEVNSATWKKLRAYLLKRLDDHRVRNDVRASAEDTAYQRGRIAELKDLLALDQPDPAWRPDEDA
ncbi:MAG: hypothetical protein AB7Q97_01740 [Gammaproteobacteria bacterium]